MKRRKMESKRTIKKKEVERNNSRRKNHFLYFKMYVIIEKQFVTLKVV